MLMKLLRHLTNAPVAIALVFLLVGTPSVPMLPDTGVAYADAPRQEPWCMYNPGPHPACVSTGGPLVLVATIVSLVAGTIYIVDLTWVIFSEDGSGLIDAIRDWVQGKLKEEDAVAFASCNTRDGHERILCELDVLEGVAGLIGSEP